MLPVSLFKTWIIHNLVFKYMLWLKQIIFKVVESGFWTMGHFTRFASWYHDFQFYFLFDVFNSLLFSKKILFTSGNFRTIGPLGVLALFSKSLSSNETFVDCSWVSWFKLILNVAWYQEIIQPLLETQKTKITDLLLVFWETSYCLDMLTKCFYHGSKAHGVECYKNCVMLALWPYH